MARIHRPPPPIPPAEHDDSEENYGVWGENEFDDGEVYENYEDREEDKEDNSDYEEPEDETTAQEAACPGQPPVPPRQGGARQAPFPTPLPVPPIQAGRPVSPRVSPIATDRRKFVPQPPVTVKDEDDEMYEAVDSPISPVDDGEVYSEVDNEPIPVLQKPTAVTEKRALPPFPKAGVVRPPVPNPPNVLQLPDAKSSKSALSPKLGRREVPAPPAVVKPTPSPSSNRLFPVKPMPQPTLPPPSPRLIRNEEEEEAEEMYEEGDFYLEKESTQAFANPSKPLPKPPQAEELDDEYYTEVPELSKPAGSYSKADRPIPPIPQQQSSSLQPSASSQSITGSTRIPVEKLQAGLARLAEAKAIAAAGDQDTAKSAEDSSAGSFSGLALANAKKLLKPVSRGESLNSAERPPIVSVKRADSDNFRDAKAGLEKKGSLLSEMKNKLESKQTDVGKVNARPPPTTHYEDAEPVKKSPTPNRRPVQNVTADSRPPPPSVSANSSRRPLVQTTEANDRLLPPKIPPSRNSSGQIATSNSNISKNLDSSDCQTTGTLSAHSGKDKPLPRQVPPSPEGQGGLSSFGWYFNTIERQIAEKKILEINQDGAFLVRKSQRGGDCNPYTLTLLYSGNVYNLHTRKRKDGKFALGTEKPDEHVFNSVEDLINFHRNNPIEVVGDARKNMGPGKVILRSSPKK